MWRDKEKQQSHRSATEYQVHCFHECVTCEACSLQWLLSKIIFWHGLEKKLNALATLKL